jgi:hypothetical protein
MDSKQKLINNMTNRLKFWLFAFSKLPSLAFWGVKLDSFSTEKCVTSVKYGWSNTNPFKSMYFATMIGAAELSTGLPVMYAINGEGQTSMLVVSAGGKFFKKAVGKIRFECTEYAKFRLFFDDLKSEIGKSGTIVMVSKAFNEQDELVGEFEFTWSLKYKG